MIKTYVFGLLAPENPALVATHLAERARARGIALPRKHNQSENLFQIDHAHENAGRTTHD